MSVSLCPVTTSRHFVLSAGAAASEVPLPAAALQMGMPPGMLTGMLPSAEALGDPSAHMMPGGDVPALLAPTGTPALETGGQPKKRKANRRSVIPEDNAAAGPVPLGLPAGPDDVDVEKMSEDDRAPKVCCCPP